MTILYCIISALITLSATFIAPHIVSLYRRLKTRKQQHLQALVAAEVAKQLKDILND
jgi:hypothetical protein